MNESSPNPVRGNQRSPDADSGAGGTTRNCDAELLNGLKARNQQAMADLFDRYSGLVYSVALRVVGDTGQAEDIMQEIFFQLWKSPDAFSQSRGSLPAWLAVVAAPRSGYPETQETLRSCRRRCPGFQYKSSVGSGTQYDHGKGARRAQRPAIGTAAVSGTCIL